MDLWSLFQKHILKIAPLNYALVGRWALWLSRGKVRHNTIAATPPLEGERFIGWLCHYLIGIAFCGGAACVERRRLVLCPHSGDSAAVRGRNLIRAVLDPAARIWFWRRGLTDSPTMAGAFAEPAGAPAYGIGLYLAASAYRVMAMSADL